jgi:hypothetical protein
MEEQICENYTTVIERLKETYCVCDKESLLNDVEAAKVLLETIRKELKDLYYTPDSICKELYCKVREANVSAYELLSCAVKLLNDQGGITEPYCFSEVDDLIREAVAYLEKANSLLCDQCDESCETSSCDLYKSSCESSCDTSSCDTSSLCDTTSCDTSSSCGSSSCDTSSLCDTSLCDTSSCLTSCSY